ncbi:MAG: GNAT family N-acetyltransferase [Pyrodictiaceae archaeon]
MAEMSVVVRPPTSDEELEQVAKLLVRFYQVNEEFDPLYAMVENPREKALELVKKYNNDPRSVLLVALYEGFVVGFIHGEVRENPMLRANPLGVLMELYVHPSYRRRGIARRLIEEASKVLREKGAVAIAAEFPYLNEIAVSFYKKLGFRPLTSVYIKEIEGVE